MAEGEDYLTTQEVAGMLRVHPESVRDWIRKGDLKALGFGRRSGYRIRRSDLEQFITKRETRDRSDADAQLGNATESKAYSSGH